MTILITILAKELILDRVVMVAILLNSFIINYVAFFHLIKHPGGIDP
jgi:hypothetical protein